MPVEGDWGQPYNGLAEGIFQPTLAVALAAWQALPITQLTGWQRMVLSCPESWVTQYEHCQATLAKKQRKAGQHQEGVFYTSRPVARYLTGQTLGRFLADVQTSLFNAIQANDLIQADKLWQAVQQVRIIDPACGTGVFLVEALDCLHQFYQVMLPHCASLQANPLLLEHPAHFVLQFQLAGIDLDPLSVMITQLRLAQCAARLDGVAVPLDWAVGSFVMGDTLLDSPQQSPDARIPLTLQDWDFILGNPPYVSEVRGQSKRFQSLQGDRSRYYRAKMDLCDGFLLWAMDRLRPAGQLAYVLPAYWSQRSSSAMVREQLWAQGQLREVWTFDGQPLFKQAPGHHTGLLVWQKQTPDDTVMGVADAATGRSLQVGTGEREADLVPAQLKSGWVSLQPQSKKIVWGEAMEMVLLSRLSALSPLLNRHEIQQGIVIPQGRLKSTDRAKLPLSLQAELPMEPGVFVLTAEEVNTLDWGPEEWALLKPYFRPKGFEAFQGFVEPEAQAFMIYTDLKNRQLVENDPECYARLRAHLDRFSSVNTSDFAPYGLHRSRQAVWFEDLHKIMVPRQLLMPAFARVPFPAYVNEGFLVLRPAQEDPDWLCAVLNSDVAWFWFYHQKRKGVRLQIDKEVLTHFPKPPLGSPVLREEVILLARQLTLSDLAMTERTQAMMALNSLVVQAYGLSDTEETWLKQRRADVLKL